VRRYSDDDRRWRPTSACSSIDVKLKVLEAPFLSHVELTSSQDRLRLALAAERAGDAPLALSHALEALALARAAADSAGQIDALAMAGGICSSVDDLDGALAWLEEARSLVDALDDDMRNWKVLNCLATVLGTLKDFTQFFALNEMAAQIAERLPDPRMLAVTRSNRASRLLDFGEFQREQVCEAEAQTCFGRVIELTGDLIDFATKTDDRQILFAALANRGPALHLLGRNDEALATIERSDALAAVAGMPGATANTAIYKARILAARGEQPLARRVALQGIATGETHGNALGAADLHRFMSTFEENAGDLRAALNHERRFHHLQSASLSRNASQRSKLLAMRLQTERALAEAAAERDRSMQLTRDNAALTQRSAALAVQAEQDTLTGLANRRRLDRHLGAACADARARGVALCVALLDIDHFKLINDHHSHAVGDQVLKQLGAILSRESRGSDLAARYGGEEFVLVLPNIGLSRALAVCERVRSAIETFDWTAVDPALKVTASIGVDDIAFHADPAVGLKRVDMWMYQAKHNGRNRVNGPTP